VLEIYKFQPFLEKRFSQIKTYHLAALPNSPVFC
jgi:hypothetical protein